MLFIGQIVLAIMVFVYQDTAKDILKDGMSKAFSSYNESKDEVAAHSIDSIESEVSRALILFFHKL